MTKTSIKSTLLPGGKLEKEATDGEMPEKSWDGVPMPAVGAGVDLEDPGASLIVWEKTAKKTYTLV